VSFNWKSSAHFYILSSLGIMSASQVAIGMIYGNFWVQLLFIDLPVCLISMVLYQCPCHGHGEIKSYQFNN
jgi:hypothetical protein